MHLTAYQIRILLPTNVLPVKDAHFPITIPCNFPLFRYPFIDFRSFFVCWFCKSIFNGKSVSKGRKNGSVLPAQLVQLCDYWLAFGFVFYKWTKSRSYFRWIEFHGLTLAQLNCHREIQYREKVMALDVFEGNTRESEWVRWKERVM